MGSVQQILEGLLPPQPTPAAVAESAADTTSTPPPLPTDLMSLIRFLFQFNALGDWVKLAILGGIVEFARRSASSIWQWFLSSFFITVHFDGDDDAYEWMMVWLSKKTSWAKARELQVSTRNWNSNNRWQNVEMNNVATVGEEDSKGRKLNFLPSFGTIHTVFFRRHIVRVVRDRQQLREGVNVENLSISIFGRNHKILHELLKEAQALHKEGESDRVAVYIADNYNNWRWSGSRPKRPLNSIILEPGVKENLIADAEDFLGSEKWYAERGIPFRRGYLLHGAPGSGKTSLIHAVAGALKLDIYVISLSKRGLDDTSLNELICDLPARSIALMEDIDAAFTHGVTRDGPVGSEDDSETQGSGREQHDTSRGITLSGLLGAIDGVAAQEGRILFATTNRYSVLDPALIRPGRLDLHIGFNLATSWQAGEIFKCFYLATDDGSAVTLTPPPTTEAASTTVISEKTPLVTPSPSPPTIPSLPTLETPVVSVKLTIQERDRLAAEFASAIPDRLTSMAGIQGHLMSYKTRPYEAVRTASAFVEAELKKKAEKQEEKEKRKLAKIDTKEKDGEKGKSIHDSGVATPAEGDKSPISPASVKSED